MRTTITFDTLEYMEDLMKSGIAKEQAEAITKANVKAFNQMIEVKELATKKDIRDLQSYITKAITTAIVIMGGLQTLLHFYKP